MAERVVSVSLRAEVANYLAGMEKARKATAETGSEAEKLAQKREAFDILGKASLAVGVAAAAGVALAVAKYAEFDQAMSNVNAAVQGTAEEQRKLSDAALEAGASTVFSATESSNAIEELAKAGISTSDVLGGALKGSLDLASAGQLGVARAAEISATALQQFKLDGDQASHVADVLAAGAGKAMGSVEDLANGLKFVGPVANSMGVSLEETTGVLALFAQQGIIGEQAGTSLRGVLASLTSPSSLARKEIEKLGLQIYDADGKFLGLENAAGELSNAYSGMDDAARAASMGVIFGRETITAATALYKAGAGGVEEWTAAVDDSGYAAQVAKDRLDNLKGDIEALGGAFDTALIQTGAAGNDVLRTMTQTLTNVIDLYNQAPEPVKATALAAGGLAAAVGLAGGAFFLGAPRVAAFTAALATMGPTAQKAGAMVTAAAGPVGLAFAGAAVAVSVFAGRQAAASAIAAEFSDTLDDATGATTRYTRELLAKKLSESGAYEAAKEAGITQRELTDAVLEGGDALEKVYSKLGDNNTIGTFFSGVGIRAGNARDSIKSLSEGLEQSADDFDDQKAAIGEATEATETNTSALDALQGKAIDTGDSIEELSDTIRGFASTTLDARDAARALEESYDAMEQSIKDNGTTLDITTEKGRANESALDGIARAALDASAATLDQTGSQVEANAVLASGRARLIEMLGQLGITGQAAEDYADKLGLIPDNVYTAAKVTEVETAEAILANLARNRNAIITAQIKQTGAAPGEVKAAYATGGTVTGPGTGTSDSILALVSNGEEITRAAMAEKHRGLLKAINSDQVGSYLGLSRYAGGGTVGYAHSPQYASSGSSASFSIPTPRFNVTVASKGGVDLLKYVDVQIAQVDQSNARTLRRGKQV